MLDPDKADVIEDIKYKGNWGRTAINHRVVEQSEYVLIRYNHPDK